MRHAPRQDANHQEIVKALKACGASVLDLSGVGKGCPDILVGLRGFNWLVEIKDGSKVASRKKLTEDEERFCRSWRGNWHRVENVEQALELIR